MQISIKDITTIPSHTDSMHKYYLYSSFVCVCMNVFNTLHIHSSLLLLLSSSLSLCYLCKPSTYLYIHTYMTRSSFFSFLLISLKTSCIFLIEASSISFSPTCFLNSYGLFYKQHLHINNEGIQYTLLLRYIHKHTSSVLILSVVFVSLSQKNQQFFFIIFYVYSYHLKQHSQWTITHFVFLCSLAAWLFFKSFVYNKLQK